MIKKITYLLIGALPEMMRFLFQLANGSDMEVTDVIGSARSGGFALYSDSCTYTRRKVGTGYS